MRALLLSIIILISLFEVKGQLSENTIDKVTTMVNHVRTKGIRCGNEIMKPVHVVHWREDLYKVSLKYATYMQDNDHFGHISKEGEDAGMRLDKIGYKWKYVGENIALGQHDFPEVLKDWIKSPSHCKMLMSDDMHHFAVAKNGKYWVQTFATPMR